MIDFECWMRDSPFFKARGISWETAFKTIPTQRSLVEDPESPGN